MAIFSSLLKSPQDPVPARVIPNGGLGGLVQFDTWPKKVGDKRRADSGDEGCTEPRKKPPPLLVTNLNTMAGARTAPLGKVEDGFQETAQMPKSAHQASGSSSTSPSDEQVDDLQSMSSQLFWYRSKVPNPLGQHSTIGNTPATPQISNKIMPVELPGSILLPNHGITTASSSGLALPKTGRARAYSERSHIAPKRNQSRLTEVRPADMDRLKSALQIPSKNQLEIPHGGSSLQSSPITTPLTASLSAEHTSRNRSIYSLNVEDLLKILPRLRSKTIVNEWIPAMEKEFAKIKSLVNRYQHQETKNSRTIIPFANDMRDLLEKAREIASHYDKAIQDAQAEVDANKQTDLEKLQTVQSKLQHAVSEYKQKAHQNGNLDQAYEELASLLCEVDGILGGFIRNKLAHTLHNTEEGLTDDVIRILRAFDRESEQICPKVVIGGMSTENHERVCHLLEKTQEEFEAAQKLAQTTSSQLDEMKTQLRAHSDRREEMEAEIACLNSQLEAEREQNEHYRKKMIAYQDSLNKALPPTPPPQNIYPGDTDVEHDVDTLCRQHFEEMERATALIRDQQLQIEELARCVTHLEEKKSYHSSPCSPNATTKVQPGRLFGSKKLKKVIQPLSRSMSNLLLPLDLDLLSPARQSGLKIKKQAGCSPPTSNEDFPRVGLPANVGRNLGVAGPVRRHNDMGFPVLHRQQIPGRLLAEERILPAHRRRALSEIEEVDLEAENAAVGREEERAE